MECISLAMGLKAAVSGEILSLSGELTRFNGSVLEQWLPNLQAISVLELSALDIEDGVAATHAVNAVRLLQSRVQLLCIEAAPQVLAHNLYRTGMLMGGGVELKDMREDEAYG